MMEERRLNSVNQAADLLLRCGLKVPEMVEYSVGIYDDDNELVATGSLAGDMIQGLAVSPDFQGEDLSARILTHLIQWAYGAGRRALYLFTKPDSAWKLEQTGFKKVAEALPYAVLMEWGTEGVQTFVKQLKSLAAEAPGEAAAVVVNCNPFTLGHQYLIEAAALGSRWVYVIVVEEDQSVFPFKERFELVKLGTAHLKNVTVVAGGRYVVSSLTFPSYFTRDAELAAAHSAMDVELFLRYIVPALGITCRYVGTEPFSPVTEIYNAAMRQRLIPAGVAVEVIPRKTMGSEAISASSVRRLLGEGRLDEVRNLVPDTTFSYLTSGSAASVIARLRSGAEKGYMEYKTKE